MPYFRVKTWFVLTFDTIVQANSADEAAESIKSLTFSDIEERCWLTNIELDDQLAEALDPTLTSSDAFIAGRRLAEAHLKQNPALIPTPTRTEIGPYLSTPRLNEFLLGWNSALKPAHSDT